LSGDGRQDEYFWALRDLNFEVVEGEVLGVIGKNGAGKTTLLKILSRITAPTEGRVVIRGRVASLLEVGTGFHPELTGRENIYLNGSILGMSKRDIDYRFDEIISFAEVEKFVDTPVKRYSSGMYVRLAFAVAAHLEPDILIVDEVLSVGDASFQKKCLGKMHAVSELGRTVIFVSHNLLAIENLCSRALFLSKGRLALDAPVSEVITEYLGESNQGICTSHVWNGPKTAPGNEYCWIRGIEVVSAIPGNINQRGKCVLKTTDPLNLRIQYCVSKPLPRMHLTVHFKDEQGVTAFSSTNASDLGEGAILTEVGEYQTECVIPPNLLNTGLYSLDLLIVSDGTKVMSVFESIVRISIDEGEDRPHGFYGREPGVVRPRLTWTTTKFEDIPLSDSRYGS
jgi:lipopolysaccharide transport system ATP-binding protein